MLEATLFPTLNYPNNNTLLFFLCSDRVSCCGGALCAQSCLERGKKATNQTYGTAKGAYTVLYAVGLLLCLYLGWRSQVTTMGKDHFFPQAAEGRVLTGSQQPYRNIFEAQLAARTVWYVAGARLWFDCAYTSCNLPSGMLIFQSLAQHQEFRIVSHGYFLWKNFFKELTQPGNGNQTGTKLLHTCQSPIGKGF